MDKMLKSLVNRNLDISGTTRVVGAEFKRLRESMDKPLKYYCEFGETITYSSKVENMKLIPTKDHIDNMATAVNFKEKDVQNLFGLKEQLEETLNAFSRRDISKIRLTYEKVSNVVNFRSELIRIFYLFMQKDIFSASKKINKIKAIVESLSGVDYAALCIADSILCYYTGDFKKCFENLRLFISLGQKDLYRMLALEYMFYCQIALKAFSSCRIYAEIISLATKLGNIELIDNINYYYCIALIRDKKYHYAIEEAKYINDLNNRESIIYISRQLIKYDKSEDYNTYQIMEKEIAKSYYIEKDMNEKLKKQSKCMTNNKTAIIIKALIDNEDIKPLISFEDYYELDYPKIIFEYLSYEDEFDKISFLANNKKVLTANQDKFISDFFIRESYKFSGKTGKYKLLYDTYKCNFKQKEQS